MTRPVQYLLDLTVLAAAFLISYAIRFEFRLGPEVVARCLRQLPLVVLLQFGTLSILGVYSFIWRYVGLKEVPVFVNASAVATAPLILLRFALPDSMSDFRVPLSVILFDAILGFGAVVGLRIVRRDLYERFEKGSRGASAVERKRVLFVGAGRAGVLALREIQGRSDSEMIVRGFVDDDPIKQDSVIHGVRVIGTTADLPDVVSHLRIDQVVITIAQAPRSGIRRIMEICEAIPVKVRIMPGIWEILQGNVQVSSIRDVEIEDLLGREPIRFEEESLKRLLEERRVLVTGAGGSIGSELARQVARWRPQRLLLLERAEFALFDVDREIRSRWPDLSVAALVADVGDEARMRNIFREHRPEVVLHAAAHKHVPLMEENSTEAIRNNVLATATLGRLAGENGVEVFVLISTDKAVRPTSIMGASKRLAELVVQEFSARWPARFLTVRFGNVLGSTGSVIPIFREQIRRGGPLTITHPDMVRYFMTIPEASQLVLQAAALGTGGQVFVLDMGEPVRILSLAKDMITLSGLRPHEDIEIVFTGVRPGEKLAEEVSTQEEGVTRTAFPKIFQGRISPVSKEEMDQALEKLSRLVDAGDEVGLRECLSSLIPEARLGGPAVSGAEIVPLARRRKERDSGKGTA